MDGIDAWHDLGQLAVIALATARVTRLITNDDLTSRPREAVRGWGFGADDWTLRWWASKLATCPYCVGWWVSLSWVAAWALWPVGATAAAVPWAVATAALWSGGHLPEDDEDDEDDDA